MRRLTLPLVLVAALTVGGCSGDDPEPESAPTPTSTAAAPGPALPELEEVWTASLGGEFSTLGRDGSSGRSGNLTAWTVGATVVVAGQQRVVAADAATGAQLWSWVAPKELDEVCTAGDPGGTAVVGLTAGKRCRTVLALDLETGRELWRADLGDEADRYSDDRVPYSAPGRLVVPTFCDETFVFDLRRGTRLADLATPASEGSCDVRTWIRDGIAVTFDDEGGGEPGVLTAVDLDRDRELFRTSTDRIESLNGIRSTDPLVLDVFDRGQSVSRVFDQRGRPRQLVGLQTWGAATNTSSLGVLDDTLVISYDDTAHHYGFDVATGEADWVTHVGREEVLGRYGDALLVLGGDVADVPVIGTTPGGDLQAAVVLGTLPSVDLDATGWAGDLLLVRGDGALTAYRLPEPTDEPLPALTGLLPPGEPDTVAPDADHGLCGAIETDTLVGLGVPDDGLPAPAQCIWYLDDNSSVNVNLVRVWGDADEAATIFEESDNFDLDDPEPLPVLGDEALVDSDFFERSVVVRLAVRHENLTIRLEADLHSFTDTTDETDVAAVQAAAVEAVRQMIAAAPSAQG